MSAVEETAAAPDDVIQHQWEPMRDHRGNYVCKTCGAVKRTSFSRFRPRVTDTPCRGLNPAPLPARVGPRKPVLTPEVFIDMLILVLAWRTAEYDADGRSFTTVDHVRSILERLELLTKKQGAALFKDARVQRLFRRSAVMAYSGAALTNDVWATRKPLVCLVPSDDRADADPLKMLRNYRVLITSVGREGAPGLASKYADTAFTEEGVEAIEQVFKAERKAFDERGATGPTIANYNAKVAGEADEARRSRRGRPR